MSKYFIAALVAVLVPGAATAQQPDGSVGIVIPAPPSAVIKPATRPHLTAAQAAAGKEFVSSLLLCNVALPEGQKLQVPSSEQLRAEGGVPGKPPEPAKVFDNLYYLGIRGVTAWAVDTPEGLILIDALNNQGDIEQAVEGGLRKLGVDPSRIKYVLVTHGHPDHYGGAQYLADKYHARILMSQVDWTLATAFGKLPLNGASNGENFGPAPAKDMVITDAQEFTLGGETLTFYITPGHTTGTVSVLIPVTDRGKRHVAALWGGTGFNFPASESRFQQYSDSARRFLKLALAAQADVVLSNHPENDNSIKLNDVLMRRDSTVANPYVVGRDAVRRFMTAYAECALAFKSQMAP
jgi:metallo-beta-lactamase class B